VVLKRKGARRARLCLFLAEQLGGFGCGGGLVLEHGADLLAQFRAFLVAMHCLSVQDSEVQHVVFCLK
jgi:hypothetical protein